MTDIELSTTLIGEKETDKENGKGANGTNGIHKMEVETKGATPRTPVDRYYFVFLIFLLHGVGVLLPWNVFINAQAYFKNFKFNTTESQNAEYRTHFLSYIGIASQIPNICLSAFNVFYQSSGESSKQGKRFITAVLINIVCLVITIILAMVDSSNWPYSFFVLTILTVIILNSCTGIYQSFIFGLAAVLPMRYSNAIIIGNNLCGTLVALCNIVTTAAAGAGGVNRSGDYLRTAAIYYFSFAVVVLLLCFDTYFILPRLRFYRYYVTKDSKPKKEKLLKDSEGVEAGDDGEDDEKDAGASTHHNHSALDVFRRCFGVCCFFPFTNGRTICSEYWEKYRLAIPHCWVHCVSVFSIFFCTLSAFPELTAAVKPVSKDFFISEDWFTDVSCFLFFNLFAMIGNLISNFVQLPGPRWLFIPVWIRTIFFIPFFMLCNGAPDKRALPVVFANDWVYIIGMIIFSMSSGYLSSLAMMYASAKAPSNLKSISGMLAAFFLVFGVSSGVQFSLLWSKIVVGFSS